MGLGWGWIPFSASSWEAFSCREVVLKLAAAAKRHKVSNADAQSTFPGRNVSPVRNHCVPSAGSEAPTSLLKCDGGITTSGAVT